MQLSSHKTNYSASPFVRTFGNDESWRRPHNANMARRGIPTGRPHHFIREWMDYLKLNQAFMIKEAGWSKATASQIYNGTQDYSPKIGNEAAAVFKAEPFELLMPPERAMAIRRLRESALQIVSDTEPEAREAPRKSA